MKNTQGERLWFWLTVLMMTVFGVATLNSQPHLSPDDFGKDLYGFEMFLKGKWPCRDFAWQYGPLMLCYYGFWFLVGGVSVLSARIGLGFLYLASSLLTYRSLRLFISPPIAFLSAVAFLIQWLVYPYYNFNHIGSLPLLMFSIFCLWKFFMTRRWRWGYAGTLALAGMALGKLNTGVFSFGAFFVSLVFFLWHSKARGFEGARSPWSKHLVFLPLLFGVLVAVPYGVMYSGYPLAYVDQCCTVRKIYREQALSFRVCLIHLVQWFWVWDRSRLGWVGVIVLFGLLGFFGFRRAERTPVEKKYLLPVLVSVVLFELFNLSDYFMLGHIYRLDYWSFPVLVLLMGFCLHWGKTLFHQPLRGILWCVMFLAVLALPVRSVKQAFAAHVPERFLDFERGRVYLINEKQSTTDAIRMGTRFIIENTKPGDEILAVPVAPLYCFLSGRPHAVREIFFGEIGWLRDWQEERMIRELEEKQVPLIVLSNLDGQAPGFGRFGETYVRKLGKYVSKHYEEAAQYGDPWEVANPRRSHAIKILQRKF